MFLFSLVYFTYNKVIIFLDIKTSDFNIEKFVNYNPLFDINNGFDFSIKKLYESIQQYQYVNNINKCYNVFSQLHNKYIISAFNSNLIIIDQYRAHNRILYEYFLYKKYITSKNIQVPISIFFSKIQIELIKKNKIYFLAMGFTLKFNERKLIIQGTPLNVNQHQVFNIFNTYLANIRYIKDKLSIKKILARTIACSIGIKHGLPLTLKEMNNISYELFYLCKEYNYTPSGKKVYITINNDFIK